MSYEGLHYRQMLYQCLVGSDFSYQGGSVIADHSQLGWQSRAFMCLGCKADAATASSAPGSKSSSPGSKSRVSKQY